MRKEDRVAYYQQAAEFSAAQPTGHASIAGQLPGQIWLVDIIFTRCPEPCPLMPQTMAKLAETLPEKPAIRFVTLTTDPRHDTSKILRQYAARFAANTNRWDFLTGDPGIIGKLAAEGMKLAAAGKKPDDR